MSIKSKKTCRIDFFLTLVFTQGDEGKSWFIILKGSVQCAVYGKGIVGTFHEGDDFGKLSLVNNSPRYFSIKREREKKKKKLV